MKTESKTKQTLADSPRAARTMAAFTLIEVLVVITIIGIIAGMVVGLAPYASDKKKAALVDAEKNSLITMIENYHSKLNYYPLDNGDLALPNITIQQREGLAATNPLMYELFGGTNVIDAKGHLIVFNSTVSGSTTTMLAMATYTNLFNRGGIGNADPTEPHNFFIPGPKTTEYANYENGNPPICGLVIPIPLGNSTNANFWHYDASSQYRHNMQSYDLWVEYTLRFKNGQPINVTNGNW